jgi:hypothetical protein
MRTQLGSSVALAGSGQRNFGKCTSAGKRIFRASTAIAIAGTLIPTVCNAQNARPAPVGMPSRQPVYEVLSTGATPSQAEALARGLGISAKGIRSPGGAVRFVDTAHYAVLPAAAIPNSALLSRAIAATRNKYPSLKIMPTVLNVPAIRRVHIFSTKAALSKTASALDRAGLTPQFGAASFGHDELSLYSNDGRTGLIRSGVPIDTQVAYRFTDPHGYPIYGPGSQVQVTYDSAGRVTRLLYATRRLRVAETVAVIPQALANERIARLLPPRSIVTSRLVYYAPPLANTRTLPVATLIPWYAYYGTIYVRDPKSGAAIRIRSKIGFFPATTDARFVPAGTLVATGGSQVRASISVRGGREPYAYTWGGSGLVISRNLRRSVSYTPQFRVARPLLQNPYFRASRRETLSVTVTDANGVSFYDSQNVPVQATPIFPPSRGVSMPTYGSENPGDPLHWVPARVAWNQEMGTPGAGATLSNSWLGDDAWPGDFIRPTPAGTLVATPWVFGDADYANWGIDTADIVLDNADGWADGGTEMQPGAPATDYATATIMSPAMPKTVSINGNGFGTPASYAVSYSGSWGPVGPNDTLEWLLLDDCEMLDALDGSNLNVVQRWSAAFGGLHVLTGFASLGYGDGPFEGGVADNVLGIGTSAQTIVQSWFNSSAATAAGTAAAMGPAVEVAPNIFICDFDDYFWGKGPVGPTLVPSSYPASETAYWYLTSTTPIQYIF